MDPARLPADWPHRAKGRRIRVSPHDWWVIDDGPKDAPLVLLLHGAGGSGHSFAGLITELAGPFRVIVPDLPGQGCSRAGGLRRYGLDAMAEDLTRMCAAAGLRPAVAVGHSAGAALALRLADLMPLKGVAGINAALGTFDGAAGILFPLMARALAATPFVGTAVSRLWGTAATVNRLLSGTGSALTPEGQAQYLRLVQDAAHVDGTLRMMASWRLDGLLARLPSLHLPVLLLAGGDDRTVPARVSRDAAADMPAAQYLELPGYGHLIHEEDAALVAGVLRPWIAQRLAG